MNQERKILVELFNAAVKAADPMAVLAPALPPPPRGRTIVIGAGKGAAQLAAAFERFWPTDFEGVVVTRYGFGVECQKIKVLEASHPVPDDAGLAASRELLAAVEGLTEDDQVIALVCGGGSALLPAPVEGISLEDKQELNRILLASGAPISVMNAIRKQFSRIKGGQLALAAHPARVVSLVVSDVPGDDPAQVASGPTVPDNVGIDDVRQMLEQYSIKLPSKMRDLLGAQRLPKPDDPEFARNEVKVIASAKLSLEAAAKRAGELGIPAVILSDAIEGEAREAGAFHGAIVRETAAHDRPFKKPVVVLSGGETTVTLKNENGRGGRNTEFLLSFALSIAQSTEGLEQIHALAADTDGIDGSQDNAGAFMDAGSIARMRQADIDPANALSDNDAWGAFNASGDLFVPGPTGTNVNDFRAILVGKPRP